MDRLDQFDVRWLLGANAALALLLLVAYGGGLLLARSSGATLDESLPSPYPAALVAVAVLLLSGVAFPVPVARAVVLKLHGLLLGALAAYLMYGSALVIVDGAPSDVRISWDPLLFAVIVAHAVYLARRLFVPYAILRNPVLKYSHIAALILSAAISALVLRCAYSGLT